MPQIQTLRKDQILRRTDSEKHEKWERPSVGEGRDG